MTKTKNRKSEDPSAVDQRKMQKELQAYYNSFKKRFKIMSKSELVAILWEQGMEFKRLQDISAQLYEENKRLNGETHKELTTPAENLTAENIQEPLDEENI